MSQSPFANPHAPTADEVYRLVTLTSLFREEILQLLDEVRTRVEQLPVIVSGK